MAYIGKTPTAAPLTSSDVTDGIITKAKLADTYFEYVNSDITALALREATNESSAAFNLPNQFIDTFTDDTNLGTQTDCDRTNGSIATVGTGTGAYETGDKSSVYTVTSGGFTANDSVATLVNGDTTNDVSNSFWWSPDSATVTSSFHVTFDLGSGNSKVFQGVKWYVHNTSTHGVWKWQGSQDNASFTDLSSNFTFGGIAGANETTWSNTTAYRYIHLRGVSGAINQNSWHTEVEFKVAPLTVNATGTLIQSANTVGSAKTKVGGTMLYKDNAGTATLGTDLIIYFTCDGGSNWTEAASYNAFTPAYSTGVKQVRLGETTCTSGTDVRYKAVWANQAASSKETQLHGIGVNY